MVLFVFFTFKVSFIKKNCPVNFNTNTTNIGRCKCNKFRQMETYTENFCCAEADEIRKDMFEI